MLTWLNKKRNQKGFTLIELIVVIAILGILMAIAIPRFGGFTDKAKTTQALAHARQIASAGDIIIAEKGIADDAVGTTAPDELSPAEIVKLAGEDITETGITYKGIKDGRYLFEYVTTYKGTEIKATRTINDDSELEITAEIVAD